MVEDQLLSLTALTIIGGFLAVVVLVMWIFVPFMIRAIMKDVRAIRNERR